MPHVKKDKFLQILYCRGGQANNPELCEEKFLDEKNKPTCSLKIIWPKCTLLCQPCGGCILLQTSKIISLQFQNCLVLIADNRTVYLVG
jgi:hypothetical protein